MTKLQSALGFGGVLTQEDISRVLTHFEYKKLEPGDYFHSINKIANEIAFVEKGGLEYSRLTMQEMKSLNILLRRTNSALI